MMSAVPTGPFFGVRIFDEPPVICCPEWGLFGVDAEPKASEVAAYLADQDVVWLVSVAWLTEDRAALGRCRAFTTELARVAPRHRLIFLTGTRAEQRNLASAGFEAIYANHNQFADAAVFRPTHPVWDRPFHAVYNARFLPYKRHELAVGLTRLALLGYEFGGPAHAQIKTMLPNAFYANEAGRDGARWLDDHKVNRVLNLASCGLCLSAVEGAMWASIEYLLAGLPVVTTVNRGGRDLYLDGRFTRWVEPTPESVTRAVDQLVAEQIPPEFIRVETLRKITAETEEFLGTIAHRLGIDQGALRTTFDERFVHRLRGPAPVESVLAPPPATPAESSVATTPHRRTASLSGELIVQLEDINECGYPPGFVGTRARLSCATSVRFLDATRLVVCHMFGQRMYLIRIDPDTKTYAVEDRIVTEFRGRGTPTDLMDFDGRDRLVTSNFFARSVSLYRVTGSTLQHERDVTIEHPGLGDCHGVQFVPGVDDLVCVTCTSGDCGVHIVSLESGDVRLSFNDPGWRAKDVCFLGGSRALVLYARNTVGMSAVGGTPSKVAVVTVDLETQTHAVVAETLLPDAHVDSVRAAGGRLYINNQMNDTVMEGRLMDDRLVIERSLRGYHFPHGLDISPEGWLAVANYGDNSIRIRPLTPTEPEGPLSVAMREQTRTGRLRNPVGPLVMVDNQGQARSAAERRVAEQTALVAQLTDALRQTEYERDAASLRMLICGVSRPGARVAVVTKDAALLDLPGRTAQPFPLDADGHFAGHPADSAEAQAHLSRAIVEGLDVLVLPASARWWTEAYPEWWTHVLASHAVEDHPAALVVSLSAG
jgi:hypothetical protein